MTAQDWLIYLTLAFGLGISGQFIKGVRALFGQGFWG